MLWRIQKAFWVEGSLVADGELNATENPVLNWGILEVVHRPLRPEAPPWLECGGERFESTSWAHCPWAMTSHLHRQGLGVVQRR